MHKSWMIALVGFCGASLWISVGCSSKADETTTPTTSHGGSGSTGGTSGVGGGMCITCPDFALHLTPFEPICPGGSTALVGALVNCLCQECGQPGTGGAGGAGGASAGPCSDWCANGQQTPEQACLACADQATAGGAGSGEGACHTAMTHCLLE